MYHFCRRLGGWVRKCIHQPTPYVVKELVWPILLIGDFLRNRVDFFYKLALVTFKISIFMWTGFCVPPRGTFYIFVVYWDFSYVFFLFTWVLPSLTFDWKDSMDWHFPSILYGKSVAIVITGVPSYHTFVQSVWWRKIFLFKEASNSFKHFSNSYTLKDEYYHCLKSNATILYDGSNWSRNIWRLIYLQAIKA